MQRLRKPFAPTLCALVLLSAAPPARAWKPSTHPSLATTVLDDARDGEVTVWRVNYETGQVLGPLGRKADEVERVMREAVPAPVRGAVSGLRGDISDARHSFRWAISLPLCSVEAQQNQGQSKVSRKLDEYGYGSGSGMRVGNDCDVDAHLDNFAHSLRGEPGSRGYMIFYHGKRKPTKYFAYDPEWQHSQLMIEWKFEEGRVALVDGGYREEAMMELWIAPEGAEAPKPSPTITFKKKRKH